MKKSVKILSVLLAFSLISLCAFSNISAEKPNNKLPNSSKVMETGFLNMLNHNRVYGEDFYNLDTIVNNSAVALLDYSDGSLLKQNILEEYLLNMYDLVVDDFSDINKDFPKTEGYFFILPRGYCEYNHKAVSLNKNEDGTYTFITEVSINTHDAQSETAQCKTIFVENQNSVFGYNIVISDIL